MINTESVIGNIPIFDSELQRMQPSVESSNDIAVLPADPTLHDINQAYLNVYCELMGKHAPELIRDDWDKGITQCGLNDVVGTVRLEELNDFTTTRPDRARVLLKQWHDALHEKLLALKKTDGCSGCFGRHANSRAIASHLSALFKGTRSPRANAFLRAAWDANLNALEEAIDNGMDVNTSDSFGRTALMLLLRNKAGQAVYECVCYLLSVPDIDVYRVAVFDDGDYKANSLGLAVRNGHETTAAYLMKYYSCIEFHDGHGSTMVNCVSQHAPMIREDLLSIYSTASTDLITQCYKLEMRRVPSWDSPWSRAFYCDVIAELNRRDPDEGRKAMKGMLEAATELRDFDMVATVLGMCRSGPPDNADDIESGSQG